ncbi:hypothetical protein ACFSUS_00195 [Spirosoma soli]|uniref:Uncharacterized protein n=1 Tax=Spirosoma soli TaxID=1770529 RepID=A0ABW5LYY6_9BACT
MNRRLFVGRCTAGLALGIVPISLTLGASSSSANQEETPPLNEAAILIQKGALGTSQRLTFTHIYSPERTSLATLLARGPQDLALISKLTNVDLAIDPALFLANTCSASHGSPSVRLDTADLTITWQALARVGGQASAPTVSTLRIMGSQGILLLDTNDLGYRLIDFRGRVIQAESQSTLATRIVTRRHVFGA